MFRCLNRNDSKCLPWSVVTQRHPEAANPRLEECAGHRGCLLVGYGHGFRPPRKPVYHGQAIPLTLERWHNVEVKVDMLEPRRWCEGTNWCGHVTGYLRALAVEARPRPLATALIDGHTNRWVTSFTVALTPGWDRRWTALNAALRNCRVRNGRAAGVDTSQVMGVVVPGISISFR